jgi:hypothetical protein
MSSGVSSKFRMSLPVQERLSKISVNTRQYYIFTTHISNTMVSERLSGTVRSLERVVGWLWSQSKQVALRCSLEGVMVLSAKLHENANYWGSPIPCQAFVSRISEPLLSKFITPSRHLVVECG